MLTASLFVRHLGSGAVITARPTIGQRLEPPRKNRKGDAIVFPDFRNGFFVHTYGKGSHHETAAASGSRDVLGARLRNSQR